MVGAPLTNYNLESHIHIGCGFFAFTVRMRAMREEKREEKLGQNKTDFLR
jgi:hypothetical protein